MSSKHQFIRKILSVGISVFLLVNPIYGFALGGFDSLVGDDRKLAEAIKSKLNVSDADAFELYQTYLSPHVDTTDWQVDYYDNESLSNSKVAKSGTRQLHVIAITDNRLFIVTFIKYMPEKQVQVMTVETLPRASNIILERYSTLKKDGDFEVSYDKASLSAFTKKGRTNRVKLLVNGSVGAVMYSRIEFYNLSK